MGKKIRKLILKMAAVATTRRLCEQLMKAGMKKFGQKAAPKPEGALPLPDPSAALGPPVPKPEGALPLPNMSARGPPCLSDQMGGTLAQKFLRQGMSLSLWLRNMNLVVDRVVELVIRSYAGDDCTVRRLNNGSVMTIALFLGFDKDELQVMVEEGWIYVEATNNASGFKVTTHKKFKLPRGIRVDHSKAQGHISKGELVVILPPGVKGQKPSGTHTVALV